MLYVNYCISCYKPGTCVRRLRTFTNLLIQSPGSSAVICLQSCRTSFFVSSVLLPEPARCTITTTKNIPLWAHCYPFTATFLRACINPWTVCPTILHTRKLNFALNEGRSRVFPFPPPCNSGATCNLLQMENEWCRKHLSVWTKPLTRTRGEFRILTGKTQTWLDACVRLPAGFRHYIKLSNSWLRCFQLIWKADNNLVITAAALCD